MQCLHILLTPENVQYGVGFFSTLRLFHGTVCAIATLHSFTLSGHAHQTTDFFYPLVDDPYMAGKIAAANVLSDLYAMGVMECDNMLMLLGSLTSSFRLSLSMCPSVRHTRARFLVAAIPLCCSEIIRLPF